MSNPITHVEQFDGSLGSFAGSGAIRYDDGLWLVTEAHNRWASNSGTVELSAGNWGDNGSSGGVTVAWTQSADWAAGGTKSLKCVMTCDDANTDTSSRLTSISGLAADTSYCVRAVINRVTPEIRALLLVQWRSDVGNIGGEVAITSIPSGTAAGVTEIATLLTSPSGTTNARFYWRIYLSQAGVAHTAYMDNHAIIPSAWIDEYFDGSSGSGFSWDGTAFASTSTRAASSASVATANHLDPSSGAIAFRITPTIETGLEEIWGEAGVKGAATDHVRWGRDATKHPFIEWSSNDAAYQRLTASETIDAGTETFLYFGHAGTTTSLQVDAGTLQTGSRAAVSASFGAGPLKLQATAGGNIVSPFATYDQPLSAARRAIVRDAMANGDDLWTLFEEWEAIIQPTNLLPLQSGEATAGARATVTPATLPLTAQSLTGTSGASAEVEAAELVVAGQAAKAGAIRQLPDTVEWSKP